MNNQTSKWVTHLELFHFDVVLGGGFQELEKIQEKYSNKNKYINIG